MQRKYAEEIVANLEWAKASIRVARDLVMRNYSDSDPLLARPLAFSLPRSLAFSLSR